MMTILNEEIIINRIVAIQNIKNAKGYLSDGERHNYWECVYAGKGEIAVEVVDDFTDCMLTGGELIFINPNVPHTIRVIGDKCENLVSINFECNSSVMQYFEKKVLKLGDFEKSILAQILKEVKGIYYSDQNMSSLKVVNNNDILEYGCAQVIKNSLELLLINMIRCGDDIIVENKLSSTEIKLSDSEIVKKIIQYLEDNLTKNVSFDDVCRFSSLSSTHLKVLFKRKTGNSVMAFYNRLRIKRAKEMLMGGKHTITEIAEYLGYESVNYFSRYFKKLTDLAPSQFVTSVMDTINETTRETTQETAKDNKTQIIPFNDSNKTNKQWMMPDVGNSYY